MSSVGFALGSNLGDRENHIKRAITALQACFGLHTLKTSSLYETPALLPEGAGEEWNIPFINAVIVAQLSAPLDVLAILQQVKRLESELGRQQRGHWAPREIDIDILFVDNLCLDTEALTLPHAQMHTRRFVMEPLAEIAPDWVHPLLGKTAVQLLEAI